MEAQIMEIERFALHDGPGIRTTVFLQGCPLHCPWCANPESQSLKPQLMYYHNKCAACGHCAAVCPVGAVEMGMGRPVFDREKCRACGLCAKSCPQEAIQLVGQRRETADIIREVLRDRDYYEQSGGGVTFSGGECFVQQEALLDMLQQSKKAGLHTAVETCGQVPWARYETALPYIDLFLFDLKHCDEDAFHQATGGDLSVIKSNLRQLAGRASGRVIVRVPVIPSFNFSASILQGILRETAQADIAEAHLLPYHTLGMAKYERLGRPYLMDCRQSMRKEELLPFKEYGEGLGLIVKIGG